MRRFIQTNKAVLARHGATAIVYVLLGTIWPTIERWHDEKIHAQEMKELKDELTDKLTAAQQEQSQRDKAQWEAIGKKKDK